MLFWVMALSHTTRQTLRLPIMSLIALLFLDTKVVKTTMKAITKLPKSSAAETEFPAEPTFNRNGFGIA